MADYREILRLDHEGQYQRQIAASLSCSRNTVSDVLAAAKAAGIGSLNFDMATRYGIAGVSVEEKWMSPWVACAREEPKAAAACRGIHQT